MKSGAVARLSVVLLALLATRCLCAETAATLGDACKDTGDCDDNLVCVLLDESNAGGERVCVPMKDVAEPLACTDASECVAAAFPVDVACVDELCACVGDAFTFACDFEDVMDAHTCRCVLAPDDDELLDAGPDVEDAGPADVEDAGPE